MLLVVTGAAPGFGRASALAFAAEGARLHLLDCRAEPLGELAALIREGGGRATAHPVDCADGPALAAVAARVLEAEGKVDVLFNNAGVMTAGPLERIPLEEWERVMAVNFWGVLHGLRAFLPAMLDRGRGYVVNTASMAGLVGLPGIGPYAASKHAVAGLTAGLVSELSAHGIGVTLLCPGATRTAIMRSGPLLLPGSLGPRLQHALERWAPRPERVAEKVLDAVWRGQPLVVTGWDMLPLWWLYRLSPGLTLRASRALTRFVGGLLGEAPRSARARPRPQTRDLKSAACSP
jgi:NAD(P)-dependent dehydrogenase (short-subunit alcohol dehydrogenase family)